MIEKFKRMYVEEGKSLTQIAKELKVSRHRVSFLLKEEGIDIKRRKHYFDEHYFDVIDTEEKAYWLGFLFADGYVTNEGRHTMSLTLAKVDENHLKKFIKAIGGDMPISTKITKPSNGKIYESATVTLGSKIMVADLIKHGCVPRKSLTLEFPNIDKHLERHFMRGYFDGDGGLYVVHETKWYRAYVLGTKEILATFQDVLEEIGMTRTKLYADKRQAEVNNYTLTKGGINTVKMFTDFLYKDASIYMDRKYQKYCDLICRPSSEVVND